MRDVLRSFSHPVICPKLDDFKNNNFGFQSVKVAGDGINYYINYEFLLEHQELSDLIKKGEAGYCVLVEAQSVFYRELILLDEKGNHKLSGEKVSGWVDCLPLVVAKSELADYSPSGTHADYDEAKFRVLSGDVLAMGNAFRFEAEKQYDSLKEISSIMHAIPDDSISRGELDVDLCEDKITLHLSPEDYKKYTELKEFPQFSSVFVQSLALPALVQAIELIQREGISGDYRWESILNRKLEAMGLKDEKTKSVYVASKILEGSFSVSLEQLDGLMEERE